MQKQEVILEKFVSKVTIKGTIEKVLKTKRVRVYGNTKQELASQAEIKQILYTKGLL